MPRTSHTTHTLTIATRQSRLALWQANHVSALLQNQAIATKVLGLTTEGDRILERPLSAIGGKGLFVKEIEHALQTGEADIAVHSLKDVPMNLPDGLMLACVLEREDPRDAWISSHSPSPYDMPVNALVGTSSLRRIAQLRALRPDLQIIPIRGNVDTRLRKLDEGVVDAMVLATAGLKRLGLSNRIRQHLEPELMLPAAAQGALAIEIRTDRSDLLPLLTPLEHFSTRLAVSAERAVNRSLGGSCTIPLAAYATFVDNDSLFLRAAWSSIDGRILRAQAQSTCITVEQAEKLGEHVAEQLIQLGAVVAVAN